MMVAGVWGGGGGGGPRIGGCNESFSPGRGGETSSENEVGEGWPRLERCGLLASKIPGVAKRRVTLQDSVVENTVFTLFVPGSHWSK